MISKEYEYFEIFALGLYLKRLKIKLIAEKSIYFILFYFLVKNDYSENIKFGCVVH